jgi:hypothetical protein
MTHYDGSCIMDVIARACARVIADHLLRRVMTRHAPLYVDNGEPVITRHPRGRPAELSLIGHSRNGRTNEHADR